MIYFKSERQTSSIDGPAIVGDLDYPVDGRRVFALYKITVLRCACGEVELC
jgi:hypothetical protein